MNLAKNNLSVIMCFIYYFQGGMYVVQLFDNYAATYSLLAIGLTECLALSWVYGKFYYNI